MENVSKFANMDQEDSMKNILAPKYHNVADFCSPKNII
jgi:hypothetical protein